MRCDRPGYLGAHKVLESDAVQARAPRKCAETWDAPVAQVDRATVS